MTEFGQAIRKVKVAEFNVWVFAMISFIAVMFFFAIWARVDKVSRFDFVFGVTFELALLALLYFYFFIDRSIPSLVVYENGIWRKTRKKGGQFIPWSSITSIDFTIVDTRGGAYDFILIYTDDLEERWKRLSIFHKAIFFIDRKRHGTHIMIMVTHSLDITTYQLLKIIETQFDKYKEDNA